MGLRGLLQGELYYFFTLFVLRHYQVYQCQKPRDCLPSDMYTTIVAVWPCLIEAGDNLFLTALSRHIDFLQFLCRDH
jgi:hypothetical protein